MRMEDVARLAGGAVWSHRLRSSLTALGIAVGVAAVVLLTSIGEGLHRYVLAEFTQFGTNLIAIVPGKATTLGMSGAVISTVRPLSLDDSEALARAPYVQAIVPMIQGNAAIESHGRERRTMIIGTGSQMPDVYSFPVAIGRFLPPDDPRAARAYVVLGAKVRRELFGQDNPLGQRVRVGGDRYRVIGVMESKGQVLGFDLDDAVYIPAGRALDMFRRDGVMEIDVLYRRGAPVDEITASLERLLTRRHGQEDFTIITQEQMLDVLGAILGVLTFAVGALGGISLVVGGVGVLTIMTIAVTERTAEIGLVRALGAESGQVLALFLAEAVALGTAGGLAGLAAGISGAWLLSVLVPALPVHVPWIYVLLAEAVAVLVGLAAGVLPARRAARLDPLEALRAE